MQFTAGILRVSVILITVNLGTCNQDQQRDSGSGGQEFSMEKLANWLSSMKNWTEVETNLKENMPPGVQVNTTGIRFYFYYNNHSSSSSRSNSSHGNPAYCWTQIKIGDPSTIPPAFNPAAPIKVLVHGWCQHWKNVFPQNVIKSYLIKRTRANLIAVDWGSLSMNCTCSPSVEQSANGDVIVGGAELFSYYYTATEHTPVVGEKIAKFLRFLVGHGYTIPERAHCIGHSLGAHICGYAGRHVMKIMRGRMISRITGLDPAGLLFFTNEIGTRLSWMDAHFVDIIHTDDRFLGNPLTTGHVNFYPNGGHAYQPYCRNINDEVMSVGPMELFQLICDYEYTDVTCSHFKATAYYSLSILAEIPVHRCADAVYAMADGGQYCDLTSSPSVIMGAFCPNSARGWYYTAVSLG